MSNLNICTMPFQLNKPNRSTINKKKIKGKLPKGKLQSK
jgi:hypothetical protein